MTAPAPRHRYTYADYLALEEAANVKHAFFDGEIYALAGGAPEHAALAMAIGGMLYGRLKGGPCRMYSSDLRVRVMATGLVTYPDVTVICGEVARDPESPTTAVNPRVVFEVSSPSTEQYDSGEKIEHYRTIPSLAAVVLVRSDRREVVCWTRNDTGAWDTSQHGPGDVVSLQVIGADLPVDELYAGVV